MSSSIPLQLLQNFNMGDADSGWGTISLIESQSLCRICGEINAEYVDVFDDIGLEKKLTTKTSTCLQIKIAIDDQLPTIICLNCCNKLEEFYNFCKKAEEVQVFLQNICYQSSSSNVTRINETSFCQEKEEPADFPSASSVGEEQIDESLPLEVKTEESPQHFGDSSQDDQFEEIHDDELQPIQTKISAPNHQPNLKKKKPERYDWSCAICESKPDTLEDLYEHFKQVHESNPIFKCNECNAQFEIYHRFADHLAYHKRKELTCKICGKTFRTKAPLLVHVKIHVKTKKFQCKVCQKRFKTLHSLKIHQKLHLPKEYKPQTRCDDCGKDFSSKAALRNHRKLHEGKLDFVCDICGRSFVVKASLEYHLLSHTDHRKYVCKICTRGFKVKDLLRKHMLIHSNVKPFKCDVCNRKFRARKTMDNHKRIHTGEMPFTCDLCQKKFRHKSNLVTHIRNHATEEPQACVKCYQTFYNLASLDKHLKFHCLKMLQLKYNLKEVRIVLTKGYKILDKNDIQHYISI